MRYHLEDDFGKLTNPKELIPGKTYHFKGSSPTPLLSMNLTSEFIRNMKVESMGVLAVLHAIKYRRN